jgi:hypothetical protein
MFRRPLCSSSGESIVLIQLLVYVTLCRWPSSVQVWMERISIQTWRREGRTKTTKLIVAIRNFANAPKNFANSPKIGYSRSNTVLDDTTDLYPYRLFGIQLFFLCVQKYNSQMARVWCTEKKKCCLLYLSASCTRRTTLTIVWCYIIIIWSVSKVGKEGKISHGRRVCYRNK